MHRRTYLTPPLNDHNINLRAVNCKARNPMRELRPAEIWCNGEEYIAMTTRVSSSLRNLAFLSIAAAGLTFAQTASTGALTGAFVFSALRDNS
jgi:hypothetical protein